MQTVEPADQPIAELALIFAAAECVVRARHEDAVDEG
jgi:hypothetical protein